MRANFTGSTGATNIITVTLDEDNPSASLASPSSYTNSDSPTVEVSGNDPTSSVVNVTFSILNSDGTIASSGSTCTGQSTCSASTDGLADGTYKVNYTVYDEVGLSGSGNLSFTVDTTKDFSVSPDFDETGVVLWDDDYSLGFDIDSNDESEDVTVKCIDEDSGDTIDTDTGGGTAFACNIGDEYADSTVDISVKVCDVAGNCETSGAESFTFDASSPSILEAGIPGSVVNGKYPIEFTASDVSGIKKAEYFYDDPDVNVGAGNSVDVNSSEKEFMVAVEGLDKGEHTVYFRVRDGAGRWSSTESLNIDYRPNANPEITIQAPNSITVTAGEETGFQITVKNTGDIFIGGSSLTLEASGVFSETQLIEDLEPSNSTTLGFSINTSREDLGKHELEISSTNPDTSKTVELVVEATQQQKNQLDTKLSDYESKLSELQEKIDSKKADLPSNLQSRLEANFSTFKQKIVEARTARQNGNYYRVSSALENIDSKYQAAQTSFENVKKIDSRRDTQRLLMMGAGFFLLLLVAGGAFYYFESDGELDLDISGLASGDLELGGVKERITSLLESREEEAEEFEWDGFKD
ncbi:MAG: Ig-like domain-containing protein [Candidatus Nanohaloarchaea archaeon]